MSSLFFRPDKLNMLSCSSEQFTMHIEKVTTIQRPINVKKKDGNKLALGNTMGTSSPLGSDPGGGVGLGMEGVGSLWWRRGGGGSKLSRRALSSMQMVFKSDALGDDWPRRSVDLLLIEAAREG
ncbi:hypothetical protein ATANTOWER_007958 [Ataeniobius toweri]|uniref:Uncharacterized protein n=1 Tax=Ataeniobius toweri TaxID=208326 RepID=A0ABU7BND5_9TELE|nr:hypothetical protein [Ataeniobius toweri]